MGGSTEGFGRAGAAARQALEIKSGSCFAAVNLLPLLRVLVAASLGTMAAAQAAPFDAVHFQQTVDAVAEHLDTDGASQSAAAATLALILQEHGDKAPQLDLSKKVVPRLCALLGDPSVQVQAGKWATGTCSICRRQTAAAATASAA